MNGIIMKSAGESKAKNNKKAQQKKLKKRFYFILPTTAYDCRQKSISTKLYGVLFASYTVQQCAVFNFPVWLRFSQRSCLEEQHHQEHYVFEWR
jgi:hypothetical protein